MRYQIALRKAKVTQKELAFELGVSTQTINDLLNGRNKNKKYVRMVNEYVGFEIIGGNVSGKNNEDW